MVRSHDDDGGDGREEGPRVACETGPGKKARKRKRKRRSAKALSPPPPPAPSQEHHSASGDNDRSAQISAAIAKQMRHILHVEATQKKETAELIRRLNGEESDFSVEDTFGDCDDGSLESFQARKVALLVSKSIVSMSSFAGGKRIRVCSGFVTDNTGANMILTSATLVRSLNGDNNVISDVTVKVLLPDGRITAGHIFLVDFHYNVAVVKVATDLPLLEEGTTNHGVVLALGREYEGADLMCSRGQAVNKKSTFGCLELLVSSCKISMAGSGGPLVNYNGQVLGINFYENNQTSYLPLLIVSRILGQHQSVGKLISPWLGLRYTSLQMVSLVVLERIYQKFPDVDQGLYVSKVVEGSPADVAGLCLGDVIVKCGEKVLSTVPEFGSILLDAAAAHVESFGGCDGDMTIEVVIKQRRSGSTLSKTIAVKMLKENNYNRWPAPMPNYKMHVINITPRRGLGWSQCEYHM